VDLMLKKFVLLPAAVLGTVLARGSGAWAADAPAAAVPPPNSVARPAPDPTRSPATRPPARYQPDRFAGRAGMYYRSVWGIDELTIKLAESGELVRFSYRVLDPARAAPLNEKRNEPSLIDARAGVSLVVPTLEKVGQLRQGVRPEAGRSYWMAFSNKGRPVRRGDRVDIQIGPFHANNLVVD
jgi:hypothetical protein